MGWGWWGSELGWWGRCGLISSHCRVYCLGNLVLGNTGVALLRLPPVAVVSAVAVRHVGKIVARYRRSGSSGRVKLV